MKATGIVRKVDELGRVVIPIELRKTMEISNGDPVEIFVNENMIILKKYAPGCVITGSQDDLVSFQGKLYSRSVIRQMALQVGIH
ncbi:AbrB/MazE/SpoVT family DNA-binding domain-containing protein [Paenibacillus wynnii]|uniref:AbrB family transcriptional regulator n=1 Tax=Paenibacillus wynnii TaxID=268407 RepID=A0A098M4W6_9BACL|nr:AbrB/MazE/SpoVT family DNA-binding domain-containing protein [Paenibacillus wynnii]KGE17599.1 AbrB family transcriptional regulator [Paenibacillus wynnii]